MKKAGWWLEPAAEVERVVPLADREQAETALAALGEGPAWGYGALPAEAVMERRPMAAWRELLARPHLLELRVFGPGGDLWWLGERGVWLGPESPAGLGAGEAVGGAGWLRRERASRLWGELLEGRELWYEERIPDPLPYTGLEPVPEHRNPFLRYREYIRRGRVEYVRFLGVEGRER